MANQVFDTAKATLVRTLDSVGAHLSAEVDRSAQLMAQYDIASKRAQQNMEQLKKNEADLNAIVNGLAQKVADANKTVAGAEDQARDILAGAQYKANVIENDAREQAKKLIAQASAQAEAGTAKANREIEDINRRIAIARDDLSHVQTQHAAERDNLAKIKRAAAEFAAR